MELKDTWYTFYQTDRAAWMLARSVDHCSDSESQRDCQCAPYPKPSARYKHNSRPAAVELPQSHLPNVSKPCKAQDCMYCFCTSSSSCL